MPARLKQSSVQRFKSFKGRSKAKRHEATRVANEQHAANEAARSELESHIEELTQEVDDIERKHAHNLAIVTKAISQHIDALQQHSEHEKHQLRSKWHRYAAESIKLETLANERSAQIHELVAVVKQVQDDRDTVKQLVSALESDLASVTAELCAERQLASLLIEQHQQEQQRIGSVEASSSFGDLSGLTAALDSDEATTSLLRVELEDVRARNVLLQEEAEDLQSRYISRSTEAKAAEEALVAARNQVASLETSLAAKTREVDTRVQQLSELEPLRKRLAAAQEQAAAARKEAETQSEAARSLTASLQNARVAEKSWRDDRDRMATMLDQAEHYEALYHELVEQTKHLVQRIALAEEEKASLSAQNAELLSHNNPNQRIMYMDRVRHELDDVKQENLSLRLQLERMQEENQMLQRELKSYRAVDMPLSQRPRTEVTRVLRATTDHEGLLRQVSGSMEPQHAKKANFHVGQTMVATPIQSSFAAPAATSKTPFSVQGPRFTAVPLRPELHKTIAADDRQQHQVEPAEETYVASGDGLPQHPPLPVDTGLSPKKRRSYGNLSVHATEDSPQQEDEDEVDEDTLLPLPVAVEDHRAVSRPEPEEAPVRRNRPRHTLVNSGALRVGGLQQQPAPCSLPVPSAVPKPDSAIAAAPTTTSVVAGSRRPSLTTSSLGIKARRVSELVRASTPPLASIADFSSLETPNHLLDAALPSPSPYGLADWTATDETSHVPGLNPHRPPLPNLVHSTPLVSMQRPKARKSRYSNAQRVAALDASLSTPKPKSLLPGRKGATVAIAADGATVYEDEHDSLRNGWAYDDEDAPIDLPDFSIEAQVVSKKQKTKRPRTSTKMVKPGPMARTFFR